MSSILTPSHPAFALPHDTARSYLTWARRLAQVEAIVLLYGSCSLISGTAGGDVSAVAAASMVMALLYLTLAYYVGQGKPRAAITLLGLSIVRAVIAFIPGVTNLGVLVAPLILADLFLFTQASRAAISLAQRAPVNPFIPVETPDLALKPVLPPPVVAAPVLSFPRPQGPIPIPAGTIKWPKPWEDTPAAEDPPSVNPRFNLDFVVASILVAISAYGLADAFDSRWSGGGVNGLGVLFGLAITVWHLPLAVVLYLAARDSEKKKSWVRGPRVFVYFVLTVELLQVLGIAAKMAFH